MQFFHMYLIAVCLLRFVRFTDASGSSLWQKWIYKYADDTPDPEKDVTYDMKLLNSKPCDENKLMLRLANLQVISPERILLLMTTENMNNMCRSLESNIEEVHTETKHCAPLQADNIYGSLFRGIGVMYDSLCKSPTNLSKQLVVHYACLGTLRAELIDCEGPADWFEKSNQQILCQNYQDILNCQYVKAAELCGLEAAHVFRCIASVVLNGSLNAKCESKFPPPEVKSPMPIALLESNAAGRNTLRSQREFLFVCVLSLRFALYYYHNCYY